MENMNQNFSGNAYDNFNQMPNINVNSVEPTIPSKYKPLSAWAYVGYNLLFTIPIVGFIFLLIFSFSDENINRRNYARSFFCSILLILPVCIIIIVLASIVMNSSTDTIDVASFTRFSYEFGEYEDQIALYAADIRANLGIKGHIINNAQNYYLAAESVNDSGILTELESIADKALPVGYIMPETICDILDITYSEKTPGVVAYVIDDSISRSRYSYSYSDSDKTNMKFYGDTNGAENHFITSNGQVFTLPGYPEVQADGTVQYHIDTKRGHYYVVKGNSKHDVGDYNINGDLITEANPIVASNWDDFYGVDKNNNKVTKRPSDANNVK